MARHSARAAFERAAASQVRRRHQSEFSRSARLAAVRSDGPARSRAACRGLMLDWPTPERSRTTIGSSGNSLRKREGSVACCWPRNDRTMQRLRKSSRRARVMPTNKQTPFLLQLVAVVVGARVGQDALLQGDDEHHRELQTLGRVQRHQGDGSGLLVPAIDGRGQGDLGEKVLDRSPAMFLVELPGGRDQLIEIGEPVVAVVARIAGKMLPVFGLVQELANDLFGRGVAERR